RRVASSSESACSNSPYFDHVALRIEPRHGQGMDGSYPESWRHLRQFGLLELSLQRKPDTVRVERMTTPDQHVGKAGERTRGNAIVAAFQFLDTELFHPHVRQRQR